MKVDMEKAAQYIQRYSVGDARFLDATRICVAIQSGTTNSKGEIVANISPLSFIGCLSISSGKQCVPRTSADGTAVVLHFTDNNNVNVPESTSVSARVYYFA